MKHCLIYVTAASRESALEMAKTLVQQHLVACANIIDRATSVYWWDGRLCEETEALLLLKTRSDLKSAVIVRIQELHSYSCPCITAFDIDDGNPAFLDWISSQTIQAR
ncbi:MAG TPA: divalent-cation tolerance protein CutA [Rhodospirillaceae bacterium]|nr:divalent-cation tolerance protein CutA [Rhodospirillaceae bacterium]